MLQRAVMSSSFLVVCLCAPAARASVAFVEPDRVTRPSLLWLPAGTEPDAQPNYEDAPALTTDIDVHVTGTVLRGTVTQRFRNPSGDARDALYVLPLSETAAVDGMTLVVGKRRIEGVIQEKAQAQATYDRAKQEGKRASLLQQLRPNLFTTALANVAAGEVVQVEIRYQDTVVLDAGRASLRIPLSVTPRYSPGGGSAAVPMTWSQASAPGARVRIDVDVDAGFPVAGIDAPYHVIYTARTNAQSFHVGLENHDVPADHDFVLTWDALPLTAPVLTAYTETRADGVYGLFMVVPPTIVDDSTVSPRETVFIIDTSGSMEGQAIVQARQALDLALARLRPRDKFEVIEFNSVTLPFFRKLVPANEDNVTRARKHTRDLQANGGTEMYPALEQALSLPSSAEKGAHVVRQIVFITDGAVDNEDGLFNLIDQKLGDARLFCVAIGSAPNAHFMHKASERGRGTFTSIGKPDEVASKMGALFGKIESPVLSGIEVGFDVDAGAAALWPLRIPDLYVGEAVVLTARFAHAPREIRVSGAAYGKPVELVRAVTATRAGEDVGIHRLWARRKIDTRSDALRREPAGSPAYRAVADDILATALAHNLVSAFTSFVAVDTTPVQPGAANVTDNVARALPPGSMPRGATGWPLQALFGLLLFATAVTLSRVRGTA